MKRRWLWGLGGSLLVVASCRIYRKPPGGEEKSTSAARGLPTPAVEKAAPLPPVESTESPSEALSLWVLNRPKTDLIARGAGRPEKSDDDVAQSFPPPVALAVLGFGASTCAKWFAKRALERAMMGSAAPEAVARTLDDMRRWRWSGAPRALHATLRGSEGEFGAVQSAAPSSFSSELLAIAVRRHGVIDGQSERWGGSPLERHVLPATADAAPACAASRGSDLHGPMGLLLRTGAGKFVAGLIDLELQPDAGMLSRVTQFGVSVAVGEWGGVVLISDCSLLPDDAIAERVYAGLVRGELPENPAPVGGCQLGYAVVAKESTRVVGTTSLAWANAEGASETRDRAPGAGPAPLEAPAPRDAGAARERGSAP